MEKGTMVKLDFDKDEALLRGYIPLHKFKKSLDDAENFGVHKITFAGNGYCTDAVLQLLAHLPVACFINLEEVDLSGCSMVTDTGIYWLTQVTQHALNLKSLAVNGCTKLTDASLALLHNNVPVGCNLTAKSTSIRYISHGLRSTVDTTGCPVLSNQPGDIVESKTGHVLVVTQASVTNSVTEYFTSKNIVDRKSFHQKSGWSQQEWEFTVSELTTDNLLFDQLVTNNCTQVIIAFDAASETREIKEHIINTISRVLEKVRDILQHIHVDKRDNILDSIVVILIDSNLGTTEKQIGAFWSNHPLTRSNNYFEVECVENTGFSDRVAVLVGIMHDVLFHLRNPMDSTEKQGGVIDGFELVPGNVYGFGIEGEWESEYVPKHEKSNYYFTRNSQRVPSKLTSVDPHIGMYPLVAVLGHAKAHIKLSNLAIPSSEVVKQWEVEDRWIEHGYSNLLVDGNGMLTYGESSLDVGRVGIFIGGTAVSTVHNTCTIKIVNLGKEKKISLGFGPENYASGQPGWKSPSIGLHGDDGKVYNGVNSEGIIPDDGECRFEVGDEISLKVDNITSKSGLVDPGDTVQLSFYKNGKLVYSTQFPFQVEKGVRGVFMVGMHSEGEKAQLMNYRPPFRIPAPIPEKITMGRSHFINVYDDGTLSYRRYDSRNLYGLFVAKTPLNKKLLYFEMQILSCEKDAAKRHIAIGLCHPHSGGNNHFLGWTEGTIAYHADNGKLYCSAGQGIGNIAPYGEGDTVGCGVESLNSADELKFDQNGHLSSQQVVKVYFTRNGERVHSQEFDFCFNGLFPACAMDSDNDKVKLLNFYPETKSLIEEMRAKAALEKFPSEPAVEHVGCEFLIVGCSTKDMDVASKVQVVQDQISLPEDLLGISAMEKQIENMEEHMDKLDLQGQENYSSLCRTVNNYKNLSEQPERLHYITSDLHSDEGYLAVTEKIVSIQVFRHRHQQQRYHYPISLKKNLETIVEAVTQNKMLTLEEVQNRIRPEVTGKICIEMLKLLHEQVKFYNL
ncbi:hypothetical protein ScPMuIL_010690 [Solemya velum]